MKKTIAAVLSAVLLSAPALAQDAGDFSGTKATAVVGFDSVGTDTPDIVDNINGLLFGAAIGHDWQSGNIVYGMEGEVTESTGSEDTIAGTNVVAGVELSRDLYAGARLGFVAGESALIYAKAGYTNGRITVFDQFSEDSDGLRLGAGVEVKLGDQLFGRGEYRYSDYEGGFSRHQAVLGVGLRF